MDWQWIPDLPLHKIFFYLGKRERLFAALTCRRWFAALWDPQLWRTFTFRWTAYPAEQHKRRYDAEMYRLYREFLAVGRHFRFIVVPPTDDFYALHGFLQQWRLCLDGYAAADEALELRAFHLTFAAEVIGGQAFGTGGRLLDTLKDVLSRMVGLQSLTLDDLLLDVTDALTLLEEVLFVSGLSLRRLSVVSVCKLPAGFYAAALFPNLQLLRLSPLHLNADLLDALTTETRLSRLVLRQNALAVWPGEETLMRWRPPGDEEWRTARRRAPWLRVRLEVAGVQRAVMWPARDAPVDQVAMGAEQQEGLDLASAAQLVDFAATLTAVEYLRRCDGDEDAAAWAEVAGRCRGLEEVRMARRTPTWLLLLLAASLPRLRRLEVRREAVFVQMAPDSRVWRFVDEQQTFDAGAAASESGCEREVAFLMQSPRWGFLEEEEWRRGEAVDESVMIRG